MIDILSTIGWPAIIRAALSVVVAILAPLALLLSMRQQERREKQEYEAMLERAWQAERNRRFYEGLALEQRR